MARLKEVADAAGRDMSTIKVSVFGAPSDAATLDSFREARVHRSLLSLPSADRETVLPLLDEHAKLIG